MRKGRLGPILKYCLPLADRLVLRTRKLPSGCIVWQGAKNRKGYGDMGDAGTAHRVSYEAFVGPIPAGLCVLHDCPAGDNPACVNPMHLWLGTVHDNNTDMASKNRSAHGERNGATPLTADDVREIRRRCSEGEPQSAIATDFGITQSAVSRIFARNTWRRLQ